MVSITLVNGRQISFDGRLLRLMMDIRERNHKKDKHYILVVDGDLGVGKSTFAQQFAAVIDDTFCDTASQKIHNAVEAYVQAIIKCDQFNSQILDEGLNGANARRAMSSLNILLQSVLTEIRQKNLLLVICVPFIFDLDRSIAIGLSDGLVHCYEKGDDNRRYFKFYGKKSKKALYLNPNNKKYYMYKGRCTFYGRFSNGYVMDEAEYRKFKKDSLQKYLQKI